MKKSNVFPSLLILFSIFFLFSCSSSENESENLVGSIEISSSETALDVGDVVGFTIIADGQKDVTSKSEIYVNDVKISGTTFTAVSEGNFKITATYEGVTSNELNLTVEKAGPRFQKNVIIEDYTGTWCGWCPRISYAIEQVKSATDFVIPIGVHEGDSMENAFGNGLISAFSVASYPTAYIDRVEKWTSPQPNNVSQVIDLLEADSEIGIAMESVLNSTNIELNVNVKFGENFTKNMKLVVLVLEDGIVEDQVNYTTRYGGGSLLSNFVHDHVLRHSLTNVLGDDIPTSETEKNNEYSKSFNIGVPAVISNAEKMSFVAIVTDGATKEVINARVVHVNSSNDFELK
jgi:hypothetical protein